MSWLRTIKHAWLLKTRLEILEQRCAIMEAEWYRLGCKIDQYDRPPSDKPLTIRIILDEAVDDGLSRE